jgi:hypothetical protein
MEDNRADDSNGAPTGPPVDGLIPIESQIQPQKTIRSQTSGHLVYDIDPEQLPTETISHGGRRIFPDDAGALDRIEAAGPSRYEVIEKISEGGMGLIYNVRENSLKREVALKICRSGLKSGTRGSLEVEEFTNEAYMTARLDHPGVVPIYALAKDADGRPFFAMKKVTGTCWKDLLHPDAVAAGAQRERLQERAAQMTWKDHLEILLKVCDAVAYAHSKAILHRDLKPENIMLGEFGEVYVMDWGLAMYFDERNEYKRFPQLKPQLAGTPYYIAPEMVRGEMKSLGPASDIYLLGGILYEILTGRPPHEGKPVMDLLRKAAKGIVPAPEETSASPLITPALSRIAMKALAPLIRDRYPTVADFQQDLREYLANSESMTVCARAAELFAAIRNELLPAAAPSLAALQPIERNAAAVSYGKLSECIGSYQQAIAMWTGNDEARRGLLDALSLQIGMAIRQDDLTLARAQFRLLDRVETGGTDSAFLAQIRAARKELAAQIEARQEILSRQARQARWWKSAAGALGALAVAGLAAIVILSFRQRTLAVQNERDMFAASVVGRAQLLEQFALNVEQVAMLYQQTATQLMSGPADQLPRRAPTSAGRDGFYFDEDYYAPATQPPDIAFSKRYQAPVSMSFPTVVRSPWARDESRRAAVDEAAARLGRLNTVFSQIHRIRKDIQWSLAGSEAGLLVGFPGSGRYRDKPDYDATRRPWYAAAIHAQDDRPVWGNPYADATTQLVLMSCVCRIHVEGRTVGVVGLEITLGRIQAMLMDFSQSFGGRRRCLLVRPFQETNAQTGQMETVHRVMVDTRYQSSAADGQLQLEMARIDEAGADVATFYRGVLDEQYAPATCHEVGKSLLVFAPLQTHDWILVVVLERGAGR